MRAISCFVTSIAFGLISCGGAAPGTVGGAARPDKAKAADVVDGPTQCREVGESGQPLIVDWPAHERTNLEEAMMSGVAVVAYDCKKLELLRDCRLDGQYGFLGLTKREEAVQLVDADEIQANLPGFGTKLIAEFGAELKRGRSLDLAMVMAGKSRTTLPSATKADLKGKCDGATHFVRGAFVGAFAMAQGTRGAVRASAAIFGARASASSDSKRLDQSREGEPQACGAVSPGDSTPPKNCRTAIRLELLAFSKGAAPASAPTPIEEVRRDTACPTGMVRSAGKCTTPTETAAHQCSGADAAECETQCKRGSVGSCYLVGVMRETGQGLAQDFSQAAKLYADSCAKGMAEGCDRLGVMHFYGSGAEKNPKRAAELFLQSCHNGLAAGCNDLGFVLDVGHGITRDSTKARALFAAACNGGSVHGCFNAGVVVDAGRGGAADPAQAKQFFERARQGGVVAGFRHGCNYGNAHSCFGLGYMHERGLFLEKNPAEAKKYYEKSCPGLEWSCDALGKK